MDYTKAELHFHTAETSVCASVFARDSIPFYKEHGYDLVCVTDHFNSTYFESPVGCSAEQWKRECEKKWFAGWYAAKEAGEKCGVTVLYGAEFQIKDHICEFLVYGMTDEIFLEIPRLFDFSVEQLSAFAEQNHLFIALAHPFRRQDRPDPSLYHGAEVCNGRLDIENDAARIFAKENRLIPICGQDFHDYEHMRGIMTRFNGEVRDSATLVEKLFARDFDLILPEGEIRGVE